MNALDCLIPNRQKAVFLAKKQLSELVYDAVNLEGINFTLPEIQTLLDGVTIGGRKLSDQTIALNQAKAWQHLFHTIEQDQFALSKDFICQLHGVAGQQEALQWGQFRTGSVTISGTTYLPPHADTLDQLWQDTLDDLKTIPNIYDKAISLFLSMARTQFFYDVNKRMGRFMMNGILLSAGYPAINLPASRQLEFNTLMLPFYQTGNMADMIAFMKDCLSPVVIDIMSTL